MATTTTTTNTLTLCAQDGVQITITREAAKQSMLLRDMMEDLPEEETNLPVPISEVSSEALKLLVEWCERRAPEEKEEQEKEQQEREEREKDTAERLARLSVDDDDDDGSAAEADSEQKKPTELQDRPISIHPQYHPSDWETKFLAPFTQEQLFPLITAANFLDIPRLLQCAATAIATQIEDMTTEEMRVYFGVKNDFTKEEEEKARKEFAWADEEEYWVKKDRERRREARRKAENGEEAGDESGDESDGESGGE